MHGLEHTGRRAASRAAEAQGRGNTRKKQQSKSARVPLAVAVHTLCLCVPDTARLACCTHRHKARRRAWTAMHLACRASSLSACLMANTHAAAASTPARARLRPALDASAGMLARTPSGCGCGFGGMVTGAEEGQGDVGHQLLQPARSNPHAAPSFPSRVLVRPAGGWKTSRAQGKARQARHVKRGGVC